MDFLIALGKLFLSFVLTLVMLPWIVWNALRREK